jgi:hypothetical protein
MKNISNNFLKDSIKKNKKKILLCFLWALFFFSINVNPENFYVLSATQILSLVVPPLFILFYFIYNCKKKIIYFYKNKHLIFNIFITYIILGIFFIFLNSNINSYLNIYWGILMLFPFLYIYSFRDNADQLKLFLILSLLILFFAFTNYFLKIINLMILNKELVPLYGISEPNFNYADNIININPRSSGLSRMSIILYISLVIYLITNQKKNYFTNLILILTISLGSIGLAFQSRIMSSIFYFFSILLCLIYFKKKELLNKNYILSLIIAPIILSSVYIYYSSNEHKHGSAEAGLSLSKIIIRETKDNFSSGRTEIWLKTIEISKKNIFKGYGFQADRKLINESAHNVHIYALICGGIISMLLILLISLRSAWTSLFIFFNYIYFKKKISTIGLISVFLIILLLQRGLFETSYGIYSIDYLFFIICFFINELNYKKIYTT